MRLDVSRISLLTVRNLSLSSSLFPKSGLMGVRALSADENKPRIAKSGALVPLTRLAKSKDMRVQRNATGALLNMTHSGTILSRLSLPYSTHTACL